MGNSWALRMIIDDDDGDSVKDEVVNDIDDGYNDNMDYPVHQ